SPWTAVLSLLAYCLFIVLTLKGEKEKQPIRKRRHDLYEKEWSLSVQAVQGHETVNMFVQQNRLEKDQEKVHDQIIGEAFNEHRLGVFKYNRARIRILTTLRMIVYGVWVFQLSTGQLDVANLIFVSVLTEKLFNSFWRFARLADQVFRNGESVNRLLDLLLEPEVVDTGSEAVRVLAPVGIRLNQVCFAYSGDYDKNGGALHDFTVDIQPGQTVALVGPSGAGKTTVRKVVTKQIPFQNGTIEVGGLPIDRWNGEKLRQLFSYVPQGDDVYIWDENVRYNIAFPRPDASQEEVEQAARLAGIHDFITTLEKGYQTLVGERGVRLSGGQKQRVALARAILADRPILILDEATSAVDSITEDVIQTNMSEILAGKTTIIIAHRLSTVKNADKIVVMDGGRKVEEGSHKDLVALGGLYAKMVALQASR
ncbi:MAG: ABC transporter ATP-binding protein, partial [Microgenomates group bacterium]